MFANTHPIKQLINSQYDFLSSMMEHFPNLHDEWKHKQELEVERFAKENSEGDDEVYRSIYNTEISRIDSCDEEEQLFNQAMLIMVYSYYESLLLRLAQGCNAQNSRPSVIADLNGVSLDGEYKMIADYLYNVILPLRNEVCHNNNGTLFLRAKDNEITLNSLVEKKYISIFDDRIVFIDRLFIKKILDGEHKLLLYLAELCGFKTKWYIYKEGKMIKCDSFDEMPKQNKVDN